MNVSELLITNIYDNLIINLGAPVTNKIFQAISSQKVDAFRETFSSLSNEIFYDTENKKLRHAAEFGAFRERVCSDFLKLYIPTNLKIGNGFLINKEDEVSTQCDLIIYDPEYTPLVEDAANHRFFPVETVVAIGEVKSTLSKTKLFESLIKLSKAKSLKKIDGKSPIRRYPGIQQEAIGHHFDDPVSFLICEKLDFSIENLTIEISKHYDDNNVDFRLRHNLVLSLNDGILCYKNPAFKKNVTWIYPFTGGERMLNKFVYPGDNNRNHMGIFTTSLFTLCTFATIYLPELRDYDVPPVEGIFTDEKFVAE